MRTTISLFWSMTLGVMLLLSLGSCSQNQEAAVFHEDIDYAVASEEAGGEVTEAPEEEVVISDRKLIKEGWLEYEVDDMGASRKMILDAVKKYGGYVSSDNESNTSGRFTNNISIRIPSNHFDRLLTESTKGVGTFDTKEVSVRDVTEEFVDAKARLKTKKELEIRYFAILNKAKTISEILEIERELEEIRSDIESIEGRLKYLENRISYSTLHVSFYKSIPYENLPDKPSFGSKFLDGFRSGWNNLVWFLVGLTHGWPFILLGVSLFFLIRTVHRKKFGK